MAQTDNSLSNIFAGSTGSQDNQLSSIFSHSNQSKFARFYKPLELIPKRKEQLAKESKKKEAEDQSDENNKESDSQEKIDKDENEEEKKQRTIFVGNIPIEQTLKSLTKFFSQYGKIDSIRLRSVPVAGTKVDQAGNQELVRKVCANARKFGEQKGSFNAYIVYKSREDAEKSLTANNILLDSRHLRVDWSVPSLYDPDLTVFIGNVPHYGDEEELRDYFARVLPNGDDDIEGIRIIRDNETLIGKGIAYLSLKNRDAVFQALTLHEKKFKKRFALRVSVCAKKKTSNASINKKRKFENDNRNGNDKKDGFKKKKFSPEKRAIAKNASRRIKLKSVVTKDKVLKERGQRKEKGRKGKKLGGVVKRAMKAAKNS